MPQRTPIWRPRRRTRRRSSTLPLRRCPPSSRRNASLELRRPRIEVAVSEITLVQAVNLALARAMMEDPERARARRGCRRRWRRLPRDRRAAETVRRRARARHAAGRGRRSPACRSGWRRKGFGRSPRSSSPASSIRPSIRLANHASRLRTRTRGPADLPDGAAFALRRRHPRGRASFGKPRGDVRPYSRIARRHPVLAAARLWAAVGGHPRPRSGRLPGADAALSRYPRGGRR